MIQQTNAFSMTWPMVYDKDISNDIHAWNICGDIMLTERDQSATDYVRLKRNQKNHIMDLSVYLCN